MPPKPKSRPTAPPATLDHRIARRVRELRAERQLTLDALAQRSGVSRSMISLVERGESSATAVVLEKIAAGLGTALASLFDEPSAPPDPLARSADHLPWRDPGSGYVRRNVSPRSYPSPLQLVEVVLPPGARVAYETGAREVLVHQQVWVLAGVVEITTAQRTYQLKQDDCLAMQLDSPSAFHNPGRQPARYLVALTSEHVRHPRH